METPLIEKAISEIKIKRDNIPTRVVVHFEEISDDFGNVVERYIICANDMTFWSEVNNLIESYKTISGISEIPYGDGIIPLKEVPYEFEGYYIRITLSRTNPLWMQIHLCKKEWLNNKNKKLINEIINNCKRNLSSWENSLDIWKETPYSEKRMPLEDIDIADSLELV